MPDRDAKYTCNMYTVSPPEDVLRVEGLLTTFNASTVSGMLPGR